MYKVTGVKLDSNEILVLDTNDGVVEPIKPTVIAVLLARGIVLDGIAGDLSLNKLLFNIDGVGYEADVKTDTISISTEDDYQDMALTIDISGEVSDLESEPELESEIADIKDDGVVENQDADFTTEDVVEAGVSYEYELDEIEDDTDEDDEDEPISNEYDFAGNYIGEPRSYDEEATDEDDTEDGFFEELDEDNMGYVLEDGELEAINSITDSLSAYEVGVSSEEEFDSELSDVVVENQVTETSTITPECVDTETGAGSSIVEEIASRYASSEPLKDEVRNEQKSPSNSKKVGDNSRARTKVGTTKPAKEVQRKDPSITSTKNFSFDNESYTCKFRGIPTNKEKGLKIKVVKTCSDFMYFCSDSADISLPDICVSNIRLKDKVLKVLDKMLSGVVCNGTDNNISLYEVCTGKNTSLQVFRPFDPELTVNKKSKGFISIVVDVIKK